MFATSLVTFLHLWSTNLSMFGSSILLLSHVYFESLACGFFWNLLSCFFGKNGGEQWGDTLTTLTLTTITTPSIVYRLKPIPIWIYQITKVFLEN
jgi:hypothetical protein